MEFCYLRVGRGKPSSATDAAGLDIRWPSYVKAAKAAGLQVGGYWRFYPSVDLASQVAEFTRRLNAAPIDLPAMVDIEDAEALAPAALTDWALLALTSVHVGDRTGTRPVLYANRSFLTDNLEAAQLTRWPLALARWTTDPAWPDERAVFWQYAGDVTVPWSAGWVDLQRRRI